MARTKQTARKSVGGKAPRKGIAMKQHATQSTKAIAEENLKVSVEYDVSYESSFYAHFFETGSELSKTFAPRYAVANVKDDSKEEEYWLTVNFNSKFDGEGIKKFGRPVINLVVALDISGSMQSRFVGDEDSSTSSSAFSNDGSKLEVAKQSILSILSQLKEDDSFGFLTFDTGSKVVHPLKKLKDTNLTELQNAIKSTSIGGGTVVTQALVASTEMYSNIEEGTNTSNRVFFLTDMEVGTDDGKEFIHQVKKNSDESIWTTVVGVGLDLTSNIIESVSKTAGCNYANVRSTSNFKEIMDKEFGYLVTPIGFNISVEMKSSHFKIEKGYGSPEIANMKPGDPIHISTEFPSAQNEKGERRAGALVFKVKRTNEGSNKFQMIVKHENLQGIVETDSQDLEFVPNSYQDNGIKKSIFLIKYTDFMKAYLEERKTRQTKGSQKYDPKYKNSLLNFIKVLENEKVALADESLQQEVEFLETLAELESDPVELKAKALAEENKALVSKLDSMTLANLKKELKKRNLSEKGKKEEMTARLKEFLENPENSKPKEENGKEEETKKSDDMDIEDDNNDDEDEDEDDDEYEDQDKSSKEKEKKRKSPRTKKSASKSKPQPRNKKLKK